MKFEEYLQKNDCKEIYKTEQSEIYLIDSKKICKHFFSQKDKENECFFYKYFNESNLIKIPRLFYIGEDFIEIEFLEREKDFNLGKTIDEISNLYRKTKEIKLSIPRTDLSKEKIFYRINYLKEEINKRDVNPEILKNVKNFVNKKYSFPNDICLVHGDLKSLHIFQTEKRIKFVDFALSGIANPWYDLSFLYLEEQEDKNKIFDEIVDYSFRSLAKEFELNKKEIRNYLQSAIFYRTLYLLGFALRHRPQKSLDRVIKELNEVMNLEK